MLYFKRYTTLKCFTSFFWFSLVSFFIFFFLNNFIFVGCLKRILMNIVRFMPFETKETNEEKKKNKNWINQKWWNLDCTLCRAHCFDFFVKQRLKRLLYYSKLNSEQWNQSGNGYRNDKHFYLYNISAVLNVTWWNHVYRSIGKESGQNSNSTDNNNLHVVP